MDITGRIDSDGINAVQFTCGGKGDVFQFDEVRVADSWAALLGVAGTASTETPTVQAANLNVAANTIATNQFTLNLNGGNGNNVLVVASAAEIAWTPADDTSYTSVSANYGSSTPLASGVYAVYNGTDANPTINLTGLAPCFNAGRLPHQRRRRSRPSMVPATTGSSLGANGNFIWPTPIGPTTTTPA